MFEIQISILDREKKKDMRGNIPSGSRYSLARVCGVDEFCQCRSVGGIGHRAQGLPVLQRRGIVGLGVEKERHPDLGTAAGEDGVLNHSRFRILDLVLVLIRHQGIDDRSELVGSVRRQTGPDTLWLRNGVEIEAGDDAEVVSSTLQRLEEIPVLLRRCGDDLAAGEDDLEALDGVARHAVRGGVERVSAAGEQSRNTDYGYTAADCSEAVGLKELVNADPSVAGADGHDLLCLVE